MNIIKIFSFFLFICLLSSCGNDDDTMSQELNSPKANSELLKKPNPEGQPTGIEFSYGGETIRYENYRVSFTVDEAGPPASDWRTVAWTFFATDSVGVEPAANAYAITVWAWNYQDDPTRQFNSRAEHCTIVSSSARGFEFDMLLPDYETILIEDGEVLEEYVEIIIKDVSILGPDESLGLVVSDVKLSGYIDTIGSKDIEIEVCP